MGPRFASFRVWQACKRRDLYKENWIEWDELEARPQVEAFRFLEERLSSARTDGRGAGRPRMVARPAPAGHRRLEPVAGREASSLTSIASQPEGLTLWAPRARGRSPHG